MRSRRAGRGACRTDRRCRRARPRRSRAGSGGPCVGAWIFVWYHRSHVDGNSDAMSIDDLVAAGRHLDAARAALAQGQHARAAELYEKLWDFRGALEAARAGGDLPRVLRYAIELGDEAQI